MQKLFTLKQLSQTPTKFVSQTLRSNPLPTHRPTNVPPPASIQPFHQVPTNCLMKVLSDPVLVKRLLPDALLKLKAPNKFFLDHGLSAGSLRAQFRRHDFQYNQPISYQKTWLSQFRRRLTSNGVVIGLMVTNVAVFLLWRVVDSDFMKQNFVVQLDNFKSGRIHTMITSAFSHIRAVHIISNMIPLYFFGRSIAHQFWPQFLLKLYLAGAFVGSVFYLVYNAFLASSSKDKQLFEPDPSQVPAMGASDAVMAIMLLDIFLNPRKTIYLDFIIPVPAVLLGIFLIGHDMLRVVEGDSQISGSAHLGGAAVAALAWGRLRKGRF